jgi:uncharacterized surface protein with fasciclin (FAS1) repeats
MSLTKNITALALLGALVATGLSSIPSYAHNSSYSYSRYSYKKLNKLDIVDRIAYYDDFSTLVAAVTAAGLIDTLRGGDFTILAPDNTAFEALPAGTVETLLKPENKETLTNILLYHVIPGKVNLAKLEDGTKIKTVLGQELTVSKHYGRLSLVDEAGKSYYFTGKPYKQTNGNIYRISDVLIPA